MTPDLDLDDEFSSLDTLDDFSRLHGFHYDQILNNGHGHNRNSSMDENLIMQQLRTGGISYPTQEDLGERSATMSRIQSKRAKEAAGRGRLRGMLPGSEELGIQKWLYSGLIDPREEPSIGLYLKPLPNSEEESVWKKEN